MVEVTSSELKGNLGAVIDRARREPVRVKTRGRAVVVIVDAEEFDRLQAREDAYWLERARQAEDEGFLLPAESMAYLRDGMAEATVRAASEAGSRGLVDGSSSMDHRRCVMRMPLMRPVPVAAHDPGGTSP